MISRNTDAIRQQLRARKKLLEDLIAMLRGKDPDDKFALSRPEHAELLDSVGNDATGELFLVSATLNRLDDGSFGVCIQCSQTISDARLEVFPYALLCTDCAERVGGETGENR